MLSCGFLGPKLLQKFRILLIGRYFDPKFAVLLSRMKPVHHEQSFKQSKNSLLNVHAAYFCRWVRSTSVNKLAFAIHEQLLNTN